MSADDNPNNFIGPPKPIYIRNEEEALKFLEQALNNEESLKYATLVFDGWPVLKVRYTGKQFHSSITAEVASAIVDTQKAINKTFTLLVHNSDSSSSLRNYEREELEILAIVKDGSSWIEILLDKTGDALAKGVIGKMTGYQFIALFLGAGALWGTFDTAQHFISERSKERGMEIVAEQTKAMSAEETKRADILARALTAHPKLQEVQKEVNQVAESYIKAGINADSIEINGLELTGEEALHLTRIEPARSKPIQPNGTYQIYGISFKNEDSISVSLRNLSTGLEFSASFTDYSLDQTEINILKDASFSRQPIYLSINAKQLRDEIKDAEIISVTQQPLIP